jgi:hypothetical protein
VAVNIGLYVFVMPDSLALIHAKFLKEWEEKEREKER